MAQFQQNCPNRVRDAVHGFIRFSDQEEKIIDSPQFQRLRRIKQLATTSFVYPGAVHTRFEHSLGVMELVTKIFYAVRRNTTRPIWRDLVLKPLKSISLNEKEALQVIRLAALFHDIGHLPYSHGAEVVLPKGVKHEHVSIAIAQSMKEEIDRLFWEGCTDWVTKIIEPDSGKVPTELTFLRGILSGPVDADRCDYLLRDSLHCGVDYGKFDLHRLLETITLVESDGVRLAIDKGGIHAIEALILARYYMFSQVYYHRTRRLFDYYLVKFFEKQLGYLKDLGMDQLYKIAELDDDDIMQFLKIALNSDDEDLKKYANLLYYRGGNHNKHCLIFETEEFAGYRKVKGIHDAVEQLKIECPECDFIVDSNKGKPVKIHQFYSNKDPDEGELFMVVNGRTTSLITEESSVIEALPKGFWPARVYVQGGEEKWPLIQERLKEVRG